jgi:fatty acid desaturase
VQIFRHPADRLPILLFGVFFTCDLAVYALVDSIAWLCLWLVLGFIPKGAICAWNHHHQHLSVFRLPALNRLLELMYGLQTGIPSHAWVLHHSLGHHVNYLDQKRDESRWRRDDATMMGEVEYSLVVAATAYGRAWQVYKRSGQHGTIFVVMSTLTVGLAGLLLAWRPVPAVLVFIAPMLTMIVYTAWATYTHHAGKRTTNHFVASNNILHRGYNILTGNLGYHTAHHYRPGVHWSRLPDLHDTIARFIPSDCYVSPGLPFKGVQRVVGPPAGMPFAEGTSVAADCKPTLPMAPAFAWSTTVLDAVPGHAAP